MILDYLTVQVDKAAQAPDLREEMLLAGPLLGYPDSHIIYHDTVAVVSCLWDPVGSLVQDKDLRGHFCLARKKKICTNAAVLVYRIHAHTVPRIFLSEKKLQSEI